VVSQTGKEFVYKKLNIFRTTSASSGCTQFISVLLNALVVQNILSFFYIQFEVMPMKTSDTNEDKYTKKGYTNNLGQIIPYKLNQS
jgi:hypothetical protein